MDSARYSSYRFAKILGLTLGKAAVTAVKSTLEAKIAELDKWAEVSASCDYEEGK